MNTDWLSDARKIPDESMNYIRCIAVHAVMDRHYSPDLVADVLNISRGAIYNWLNWYRNGGDKELDTKKAPGALPVITPTIEQWIKHIILHSMPIDYGYDTQLWTLKIIADLLKREFGISVYESTIANHLHKLNLSCQVPCYRAKDYDPIKAEHFLSKTWHKIQRLAEKMEADIAFEDEAGIGIMTRSGRTWSEVSSSPIVPATDKRGGYNLFSAITPQGNLHYRITDQSINSEEFIWFLEKILREHPRPIILIVDHASFHDSKKVRDYVRAHRYQIRIFFLPKHAPHLNPDEQVWNEIKHRKLWRQPIFNKRDLIYRLANELRSLRKNAERIISLFHLKDTKYVLNPI